MFISSFKYVHDFVYFFVLKSFGIFLFTFLASFFIFLEFCSHFGYIFQVLLERAEKYTGQDRRVLVTHLHDLMSVQASLTQVGTPRVTKEACIRSCSELTQYQTCPCNGVQNPCRNSGCSHLCLITPVGKKCACPNGQEIGPDGLTCLVPDAYLLFLKSGAVNRASIKNNQGYNLVLDFQNISALDVAGDYIYWYVHILFTSLFFQIRLKFT